MLALPACHQHASASNLPLALVPGPQVDRQRAAAHESMFHGMFGGEGGGEAQGCGGWLPGAVVRAGVEPGSLGFAPNRCPPSGVTTLPLCLLSDVQALSCHRQTAPRTRPPPRRALPSCVRLQLLQPPGQHAHAAAAPHAALDAHRAPAAGLPARRPARTVCCLAQVGGGWGGSWLRRRTCWGLAGFHEVLRQRAEGCGGERHTRRGRCRFAC